MPDSESSDALQQDRVASTTAAGRTILLVEDHPGTRAALADLLRSAFLGCQLLVACSGEDALALCSVEKPDLVIMDIMLPGINGIEATRLLRQTHPDISIVMHSSSDQAIYRAESLAAGANVFVGKGGQPSVLIATIHQLLSQ